MRLVVGVLLVATIAVAVPLPDKAINDGTEHQPNVGADWWGRGNANYPEDEAEAAWVQTDCVAAWQAVVEDSSLFPNWRNESSLPGANTTVAIVYAKGNSVQRTVNNCTAAFRAINPHGIDNQMLVHKATVPDLTDPFNAIVQDPQHRPRIAKWGEWKIRPNRFSAFANLPDAPPAANVVENQAPHFPRPGDPDLERIWGQDSPDKQPVQI